MEQQSTEHEINVLDLLAVLLQHKRLISCLTVLTMIIAIALSIISLLLPPEKSFLPNYYAPKALMLIDDSSSSMGSLSSMLSSSGLSDLANITGMNVSGGSTYSALAVFLTQTNWFLDAVNMQFNLSERYKVTKKKIPNTRILLKKRIKSEFDEETGVFSIEFSDRDPVVAQAVVNYCVYLLDKRFKELGIDKNELSKDNMETSLANSFREIQRLEIENQQLGRSISQGKMLSGGDTYVLEATRIRMELAAQQEVYTQLKTQFELIKVQLTSASPVFQVLELAEAPELKSGPSRGMICIVSTFAVFILSVFLAFLLNAIEVIKNDPVSMSKIHGVRK